MQGRDLALIITRVFQLLCACVVLGTSVDLAKDLTSDGFKARCKFLQNRNACNLHGLVPAVEYGAFVGAWGLIDWLIGLISVFVTAVPWLVVAIFDILAIIFYFAGGVRYAVWISDYKCSTGGHCTELKADTAFMFLGFLVTVALLILGFFWQRRAGKRL